MKLKLTNKSTGIISFIDLQNIKIRILYWAMFALMLTIVLFWIFPIIWVMISSAKNINEFFNSPPTIFPRTFEFNKVIETWNTINFTKLYLNSISLAGGELLFCVTVNGLGGYAISRLKPKGGELVFTLILWTMMMPNSISMVPLFMTFLDFPLLHLNLTNSYWPMWLMAGASPFYVLVFKSFFDNLPMSYLEAARLDGCSDLGIFARIIIPLSKPVVMVVAIFCVNASWEQFLWPYLVLKDQNLYTVIVKIFSISGGAFPIDSQIIALVFAVLPPILIFLFLQKYIMTGLSVGGIKG